MPASAALAANAWRVWLLRWGDGEWMRTWESDCDSAGVNLVCESVICTETPDDAALEACRALGKALVE